MNITVKVSLTDEQRRVIHTNLYDGKKGMVSRKDVNAICQTAITDMLIGKRLKKESNEPPPVVQITGDDELRKQNELLTTRVNRLQYMIDTRGLKK